MSTPAAPPSTAADASVLAPGSAAANASPDTAASGPGTVTACGLISEKEPLPHSAPIRDQGRNSARRIRVGMPLRVSVLVFAALVDTYRRKSHLPP